MHVYFFAVVDFFNRINLIYGTVTDYCTEETCPTMSGGPKYDYFDDFIYFLKIKSVYNLCAITSALI